MAMTDESSASLVMVVVTFLIIRAGRFRHKKKPLNTYTGSCSADLLDKGERLWMGLPARGKGERKGEVQRRLVLDSYRVHDSSTFQALKGEAGRGRRHSNRDQVVVVMAHSCRKSTWGWPSCE